MNVFDFDNTIYDGESAVDFFMYYLKKDKTLIKNIPQLFIAIIKYKAGKISIEEALNKYGKKVTEYYLKMTSDGTVISEDCEDFWNTHMQKIKPFYNEIKQDDDIIISCSPEFSLKVICGRLGIKNYIGTEFNEKTGEFTRLCFRENKVKAFLSQYPDSQIENFYTDSMNDKPLMDISKNVYLVKGRKIRKIK